MQKNQSGNIFPENGNEEALGRAVNHVGLHPFFVQEDAIAVMREYGVAPQAWEPLAEGKHGIFTDPELTAIGEKDLGHSEIINHFDPQLVKALCGMKIHE